LYLLEAVGPHLLAIGQLGLLTLQAASLLALDATNLLAFDACLLALDPADLLPLNRTGLLTFDAADLLALDRSHWRPFETSSLLALDDAGLPALDRARLLAHHLTLDAHLGCREAAAAASATAAPEHGWTATPAASRLGRLRCATAALLRLRSAAATSAGVAAARRLRCRPARNRQSGDPGGQKQPGHRKISSRTVKTARSPHRSNT
jgi:hypothetical protein